jgi:hypothetical protein
MMSWYRFCSLWLIFTLIGCTETKVGIRNTPPLATITSHETDTEVTVETVVLVGQVSDAESDATDLWLWWEQDGETICEETELDEMGMTVCEATVLDPSSEFVLKVQDPKDALGLDRIRLLYAVEPLPEPLPPTAEITSPTTEDRLYTDIKISFTGMVGDTEDASEELEVVWTSDVDGELSLASVVDSDGQVTGFGYLSAETHALTLRVTDTDGQTGSDSVVVEVGPVNSAPSCAITAPLVDEILSPGETVVLEGVAADVDQPSNTLTARWSSDHGGFLGSSTPTTDGDVLLGIDGLSANTHVLTLTVIDELEAVCSDAVLVNVGALPAVEGVQISPDPPQAADELGCAWTWLGTAGSDASTVAWAINGLAAGTVAPLSGGFVRDDTVSCTVTPFDGTRTGEPQTDTVVVANTAPSIESVFIEPVAPDLDDTLSCSWTGFADADGDADVSVVSWTVDGVVVGTASTLSTGFVGGDEVMCTVTPHDGVDAGAPVSATVTVVDTPPVLASVSLTPLEPTVADVLVCTPGLISDADGGEAFAYSYRWVVADADVGVGDATLSAAHFARDQAVTCHVTPSSGGPSGLEVASNTVVVGNSAPALESVTITPDPASPADVLTCAYTGFTDPDGDADSSRFEWSVGGTLAGTGPTLSGGFSYGDTVQCTVTPSDGTDDGESKSDAIIIVNTPPEILSLELSPSDPVTTTTLNTAVSVTDAEGDGVSLAYQWTVDGIVVGPGDSSLEPSWFVRDEVVRVMVTPSDTYGVGVPVTSDSVTIGNTAPGAPGVSITPGSPVEGEDDLMCVVSSALDVDEDVLTYEISWTRDDELWEGPVETTEFTGDTISGMETVAHEEWVCTVVPSDDVSTGPAGSASVEIDNAITRVFVSSFSMNGDLGGPTGADELCTNAAMDADLGGTWSAFLSGGSRSAISHIADGPYHRLDGVLIATDRADLADGSISAPINVDENGSTGVSDWVFTGSTAAGTVSGPGTASGGNCVGWTQGHGVWAGDHWYAHVGKSYRSDAYWVVGGNLFCSHGSRVYCFED